MGLLSLLLWTPALGALLLVFVPSQQTAFIRYLAHLFAGLALLLGIWLVVQYDRLDAQLQFNEYFPLNPTLGSAYALGVDGLSLPMLLLSTLLTAVALLASSAQPGSIKGYHICILLVEFGMLGVFLAQDWALFYIFWEIMLIPLFFLIGHWGDQRRHAASLNFVLSTLGGSLFMLISLLAISQYGLEHGDLLMTTLHQAAKAMPLQQQIMVLLGFLLGFGLSMATFPLHGWLPLALIQAPAPVSLLLAGILLKMGAYGLIRVIVMLPEAAQALQPLLVFLAWFGMLYGGLLAWRQSNLKAMVAYSSISHTGAVLFGVASLNELGMTGAVLQMTAHSLIAASLLLMFGILHIRTQTNSLFNYSNLIGTLPHFSVLLAVVLLAAMGLPSFVGFMAQLHILLGGFQQWRWLMVVFCLGWLINAAYPLRVLNLLLMGPAKPAMRQLERLKPAEWLAASILAFVILGFGLYPAPLMDVSAATNGQLAQLIQQRLTVNVKAIDHAQ